MTVIGDTIGGPLRDSSGPLLNIFIKLMAVESLVIGPFFAMHGAVNFKLLCSRFDSRIYFHQWSSEVRVINVICSFKL